MDLSYKNINLISKETQEFNQAIIEDYSRILLRIESNNHCNFK